MAPKHATRDALLVFLRLSDEPRPLVKIYQFMAMWGSVKRGATREQLRRLVKAGVVVRDSEGRYGVASGALRQTNAPD